jgi:hypothetical protein
MKCFIIQYQKETHLNANISAGDELKQFLFNLEN